MRLLLPKMLDFTAAILKNKIAVIVAMFLEFGFAMTLRKKVKIAEILALFFARQLVPVRVKPHCVEFVIHTTLT